MDHPRHHHHHHRRGVPGGFLMRWIVANSVISGICALLWVIFRCGTKPSRLAYPCQQAAISTAALAFGAPVVAAAIAARRRIDGWMRRRGVVTVAAFGLVVTTAVGIVLYRANRAAVANAASAAAVVSLDAPRDYRAQIYHVTACPQDPAGDRFVGLSNLLVDMGRGGLKFYRSDQASPLAGPAGVVAPNDVVVIKINYQWPERGGTNTDLLRGLIRTILDHPDGFTGEVIVCENAQFNSTSNLDRSLNNAQDHSQSPHDVVAAFQAQGYRVSHTDWTVIRASQVSEYSAGNMTDGYVIGAYDSRFQGKLSYAKFRSALGTYVSMRYGIWNPGTSTYDRAHLKFINVPVLKSHHATYGATVCTKHYMGVVTDQFSTNSHNGIRLGIMGALMDQIQMADLQIVDAIWINANPNTGPQTPYTGATRRDELVGGLDPIAIDRWSVKNILIPGFISNGFSPPWPNPSADPDLATGAFRVYLDNSMNLLLASGHAVTNDYAMMDVHDASGGSGDFDHNGTVDMADYGAFAACFTGPGGGPVGPECAAGDFDGDGDVDCTDWSYFKLVWTSTTPVPELPACSVAAVGDEHSSLVALKAAPNPTDGPVDIRYSVASSGPVRIAIYDGSGRLVRTLACRDERAGSHVVRWDGRDEDGRDLPAGVYFTRVVTGHGSAMGRAVIAR